MLGPQNGMGPVWLQDGRFRKCDEFHAGPCDPVKTDTCCAVVPCTYCLEWIGYDPDETKYAVAEFDTDAWIASIDDRNFTAYWERDAYTGVCEFVAKIDDLEIARLDCNETNCRDSSYTVTFQLDLDYGVIQTVQLTWTKYELLPLPYIKTDEGCTDFFCGDCECTCNTLCALVNATINDYQDLFFMEGADELPLVSYPCDGPAWEGDVLVTLGALSEVVPIAVHLYRDPYDGLCWITGVARGEILDPQRVYDCKQVSGSWQLEDGTYVGVRCKGCTCESRRCEWCCLPMDFSQPQYPAGVVKGIPYYIECGDMVLEGSFQTSPSNLPCQTEVFFYGPEYNPGSQFMNVEGVKPDGSCASTPCTNTFRFLLECTERYVTPGDDTGCDRLWLWVGSRNPIVGDVGEQPPNSGGFPGVISWYRIRATSCSCDEAEGIAAIFYFDITVDCSDNPTGLPYGPCEGITLDCCYHNCSGSVSL